MNPETYRQLASRLGGLRVAVAGDYCLDRYFEIDPDRREDSLETGLPVRNVVSVRCQPGGAGTILTNLAALGVGTLLPVGFAGEDGEGWELVRALEALPGVRLDHFFRTGERRTFTYTKPLVMEAGRPPRELERIDIKNWSPTPPGVTERLCESLRSLGAGEVDALIFLEQVDVAGTGVFTDGVLATVDEVAAQRPDVFMIADSRRGLAHFPPVGFKMNRAEFTAWQGLGDDPAIERVAERLAGVVRRIGRPGVVTLAADGIVGATPGGAAHHVLAEPVRGEIDIVGAGDAVTAHLTAMLASGATLEQALRIAVAAAAVVIHKLGTTGTATADEIAARLSPPGAGAQIGV